MTDTPVLDVAPPVTLPREATAVDRHASQAGYYGKPIVRAHIWEDAIGWYFFTGGLAGASSVLAEIAELTGHRRLAVHARRASMIGLFPSPILLIVDLGRPKRFYNMLRVFKVTSPMSVGSWLLAVYSPAAAGAWLLGELGRWSILRRACGVVAAAIGPAIATYTAVLVADTATPVWHEAKDELPFVFAASAVASAGGAANILSAIDGRPSTVTGRLAIAGAVGEVVGARVMKRRLGPLDTYDSPEARPYDRAAAALSLAGAAVTTTSLVLPRWRRVLSIIGSAAVLAGSICERLAVVRAGTASANDPRASCSNSAGSDALSDRGQTPIERTGRRDARLRR